MVEIKAKMLAEMSEKKKVELVVGKKVAVGVTKRLLKWLQRLTGIVAESMDNSWLEKMIMSVKLLLEINELLLFDVDIRIRLLVKVNISDSWCC